MIVTNDTIINTNIVDTTCNDSNQVIIRNEDDDDDVISDEGDDDDESPYRDPPPGFLKIRQSKFNFIPGTVFVEYPPELGITRNDISKLEKMGRKKLHYSCYWGRNCIKNAFRRAGFENSDVNWTAMWSKHQPAEVISSLNCLQKVNHFPASWCIGRKDRLMRTMQAMRRIHGDEYAFHPEGFTLPSDGLNLERCIKLDGRSKGGKRPSGGAHKGFWIIKPVASSCGRGIKVVNSDKALALAKSNKKLLVQRYLADPYLINRKKFDLRMYCLVTGVDPLRVYIHEEGLTRISTQDYNLKNLKNRFSHLTNYSINKKSANFVAATEEEHAASPVRGESPPCSTNDNGQPTADNASGEVEGYKWSLRAFRKWLVEKEGEVVAQQTWKSIDDIILKTIIAAEPELTHSLHSVANYRTNCFELFGFDIFLDKQLSPHLVEVNISPSLMGSSPLDKRIKGTLVADVCHVTGFHAHDPALLAKYSRLDSKATVPGAGARVPKYKTYMGSDSSPSQSDSTNSPASRKKGSDDINPFSFNSLSKMMGQQDLWRKEPSPMNIDMQALGNGDSSWMMMLMVEDEFSRAESSFFRRIHPRSESVVSYLNFYKNPRFSDHLLGRWVLGGLSSGSSNAAFLPARFTSNVPLKTPVVAGTPIREVVEEPRSRLILPKQPGQRSTRRGSKDKSSKRKSMSKKRSSSSKPQRNVTGAAESLMSSTTPQELGKDDTTSSTSSTNGSERKKSKEPHRPLSTRRPSSASHNLPPDRATISSRNRYIRTISKQFSDDSTNSSPVVTPRSFTRMEPDDLGSSNTDSMCNAVNVSETTQPDLQRIRPPRIDTDKLEVVQNMSSGPTKTIRKQHGVSHSESPVRGMRSGRQENNDSVNKLSDSGNSRRRGQSSDFSRNSGVSTNRPTRPPKAEQKYLPIGSRLRRHISVSRAAENAILDTSCQSNYSSDTHYGNRGNALTSSPIWIASGSRTDTHSEKVQMSLYEMVKQASAESDDPCPSGGGSYNATGIDDPIRNGESVLRQIEDLLDSDISRMGVSSRGTVIASTRPYSAGRVGANSYANNAREAQRSVLGVNRRNIRFSGKKSYV